MSNKEYWNGNAAAHRRIMYKGAGYSDDDIKNRLHIGVANTFSDASPATAHLRMLGEAVKQGIWSAGGVPFEFGVPGLCGNIAVGHDNCRYELAERDLVCGSIEVVSRINNFDGLVTLSSCDDILAGSLLGVGRVDIPAVMVTGGPMMPGCHNGKKVLAPDIEEAAFSGTESEDFAKLEDAACPGFGSCGVMGTANTMQILVEALGLALPGTTTIPAVMADKIRGAREAGRAAVRLAERGITSRRIITRQAILNAIVVYLGIGGSTNAILHLLALAREVGVGLEMDDFDRISRKVSCILAVRPNGPCNIVDLHGAGGVPAVQKELEPLLDLGVIGVSGFTLGEVLAPVKRVAGEVLATLEQPVSKSSGLAVLKGNLAPEGAIVRPSGVPEEMKSFSGPARVFDDEKDAISAMKSGAILPGDVIVLRYMGPKGAPGMMYAQASCQVLVGLGLHKSVGLVTDGRFSGFNHGPIVGHVCPEAFDGGPLALVCEGDTVSMDIDSRVLRVDLDDQTLAERRAEFRQPEHKVKTGWLGLYSATCCSASKGAAMQPW
ncbi:dihydroxy-acid dehydratase [Desulforhopalus singaporensis]|uniref:Dihydroxy-acid dehydratase n=1 Tax=Desulforhopalus singaporensis TaxID=91360 RepID=A0A1H0KHJ7_9BACT|nr:dihydroxy-acid dehydratase [Desulforhopalus singaporensis]SDO55375.1 dihydroxy-acid dehydratase [Desulforhopalus singaporensis]